jgi:hypothetical protein
MRLPCTRIRNKIIRAGAQPSLAIFLFFPGDASHVAARASKRQLRMGIPKSSLIITIVINNSASPGVAPLFSALLYLHSGKRTICADSGWGKLWICHRYYN